MLSEYSSGRNSQRSFFVATSVVLLRIIQSQINASLTWNKLWRKGPLAKIRPEIIFLPFSASWIFGSIRVWSPQFQAELIWVKDIEKRLTLYLIAPGSVWIRYLIPRIKIQWLDFFIYIIYKALFAIRIKNIWQLLEDAMRVDPSNTGRCYYGLVCWCNGLRFFLPKCLSATVSCLFWGKELMYKY